MRIVFLVPGCEGRPLPINGYSIRYGNAPSSGTEQSVILVSEYLVSRGHEVTIVIDKTDFKETNGVRYTDLTYKGIPSEVDILISMLWFEKYNEIPFRVKKTVGYWFHMAWGYSINEIAEFAKDQGTDVKLVYPSSFARYHANFIEDIIKSKNIECSDWIIPNPLDEKLIKEVKSRGIKKNPKKAIFLAQFSRGGALAEQAIKELGDEYSFESFDYLDTQNGVDKKTILEKLAEAEYFIFPLYHPNGCVYKDTFSCSVAEAIAMETKVITYPLGAFTEYFNAGCYYVKFPDGADPNEMYREKVSCDAFYMDVFDPFVSAVKHIEKDPSLFQRFDITSNHISSKFFDREIGKKWERIFV